MQSIKINISDITQHSMQAKELIDFAQQEKVFLFNGEMGAGKTTFIKSLCLYLGVTDSMSSPTYSIVNEYHTSPSGKIYHFDLYRLKNERELFDIGFEEYIDSGFYNFIEWPELGMTFIANHIKVNIEMEGNIRYLCAEKI